MKHYHKLSKEIVLAGSREMSLLIARELKDFFPIEHEIMLDIVLKNVDDWIKFRFDVDILEYEFLKGTKNVEFKKIVVGYFAELRKFSSTWQRSGNQNVVVETYRRRSSEPPVVGSSTDPIREREQHLQSIIDKWSDYRRIEDRLRNMIYKWEEGVTFKEYPEDPIHQ